jgi:hypothetical protein
VTAIKDPSQEAVVFSPEWPSGRVRHHVGGHSSVVGARPVPSSASSRRAISLVNQEISAAAWLWCGDFPRLPEGNSPPAPELLITPDDVAATG